MGWAFGEGSGWALGEGVDVQPVRRRITARMMGVILMVFWVLGVGDDS